MEDVIDKMPEALVGGIYWGFANVDRGPVHGMVMSIGQCLQLCLSVPSLSAFMTLSVRCLNN